MLFRSATIQSYENGLVETIHQLARRQSLNVDAAIDDIISTDLDFPC